MGARSLLVAWFVAALLAQAAHAQLINAQPLTPKESFLPKNGLLLNLEAAVDWRTGNNDLLQFSNTGLFKAVYGRHTFFAYGIVEFGIRKGANFINRDVEQLRYRLRVVGPLDLELFAQHDRDEFRLLTNRFLGAGDLRLTLFLSERLSFAVAGGYLFEYEAIPDQRSRDPNDETHFLTSRLLLTATLLVKVTNIWSFSESFIYIQSLYRHDLPPAQAAQHLEIDFRLFNELAVIAKISERFSFKVSLVLQYDNNPPIGFVDAKGNAVLIKELDSTFKASLQFTL